MKLVELNWNPDTSVPPLAKGNDIYTSPFDPKSIILPPPVVGEGRGGGANVD